MSNKFSVEFENLKISEKDKLKALTIMANALNKEGLIANNTLIDGVNARHIITNDDSIMQSESSLVSKLGALLVNKDLINDNQLQKALSYQKHTPSLMLGEILVKLGFIKSEDLNENIEEQKRIRETLARVNKIGITIDYTEPLFELKINRDSQEPYSFYQKYEGKDISKAIIEALSSYFANERYSNVHWKSEIVGLKISVDVNE